MITIRELKNKINAIPEDSLDSLVVVCTNDFDPFDPWYFINYAYYDNVLNVYQNKYEKETIEKLKVTNENGKVVSIDDINNKDNDSKFYGEAFVLSP